VKYGNIKEYDSVKESMRKILLFLILVSILFLGTEKVKAGTEHNVFWPKIN